MRYFRFILYFMSFLFFAAAIYIQIVEPDLDTQYKINVYAMLLLITANTIKD